MYNLSKVDYLSVTAYHAKASYYITSTLRYGVIFWGNSTNKEVAFKAQKICLRPVRGIQINDQMVVNHFSKNCIEEFIRIHV